MKLCNKKGWLVVLLVTTDHVLTTFENGFNRSFLSCPYIRFAGGGISEGSGLWLFRFSSLSANRLFHALTSNNHI